MPIIPENATGRAPKSLLAKSLGPVGRAAHERHKRDATWYGDPPQQSSQFMPAKRRLPLDVGDLANLRESGLTDATIRANGLKTENDSLVFAYHDLEGKPTGFTRRRPHKPRRDKDGKAIKYEAPKGSTSRAYFPAASRALLTDAGEPFYVTEGEKKALALSQLGLAAVGIGGIWNGCETGSTDLLDDLAALPLEGRTVYIVFDYDEKAETRAETEKAAARLAGAFRAAGAGDVRTVDLLPGPAGEKQGVDDFLLQYGEEAFRVLVDRATPVRGIPVNKIITVTATELAEAAYHGFVGRFLRAVAPYTEATDAGVLAHLLPAVGVLAGPGFSVCGGRPQHARVNTVVVGPTNAGRKGTSFGPVDQLMRLVNPEFWTSQQVNGLSSGEGLIAYVADRVTEGKDGTRTTESVEKRLYVVEEEFSRVLATTQRDGNILSQIIRSAFDDGNIATLTRNPLRATGTHISITGHITPEELVARLKLVEMASGFANRFLWFYVCSDKILTRTTQIPDSVFLPFEKRLRSLLTLGNSGKSHPVELTPAAQQRWDCLYPELREDSPGLLGLMTARGSAMVLRTALIYALLEERSSPRVQIEPAHLEASLAVWRYSEKSVSSIFKEKSGDVLGDKLLDLLSLGPKTKTEINRHLSLDEKNRVGQVLTTLQNSGQVRRTTVKHDGAGRPAQKWERV